jgi:hypothetical protein
VKPIAKRKQALDIERLFGERIASGQHTLAQHDKEEQPEALNEMLARDVGPPGFARLADHAAEAASPGLPGGSSPAWPTPDWRL